jgi:hypothetical protein
MADEDEDVTVQLAEQTPEGAADPVAELKAQYDQIQQQQKEEQKARQDAEARARDANIARQEAEEAARSARTEAQETRQTSLDRGLESAKAASDAAKSEYTAAMEAGDWKKAAEAQEKLADARSDLRMYEYQKQSQERQPVTRDPAIQGDPIDAYINNVGRTTPNSANWLRSHRDWITDPQKNAKLTSAHWDAVGEGIAVDSPEYFAHVERKIGMTKEAEKTNGGAVARKPAVPVAAVSPSPGGTSGGGGVEVKLTKGEALNATDGTLVWNYDDPSGQKRFKKGDPIGLQEMARRKRELKAQGAYDKSNYEA